MRWLLTHLVRAPVRVYWWLRDRRAGTGLISGERMYHLIKEEQRNDR